MSRELSADEVRIIEEHRVKRQGFLAQCKADPYWEEVASEQGAIAHGYYDAVEQAMIAAAQIARRVIEREREEATL